METCPNCKTQIKESFLGTTAIISKNKSNLIRHYYSTESTDFCTKCGKDMYAESKKDLIADRKKIIEKVSPFLKDIPIVTLQNPTEWNYTAISIITSQITMGTGVLTEISSSISDFFGSGSGRMNAKLKDGENACMTMLRTEAFSLGANAIIATDIDYAEVGGVKAMLMVCMAGTAVKLKNYDILPASSSESLVEIEKLYQEYLELKDFVIEDWY